MTTRAGQRGTGWVAMAVLVGAANHAVAAHLVTLDMRVTLDQVADRPELKKMTIGHVDQVRITYDADTIDKHTHHVPLVNFQHFINGQYAPAAPDPVAMPMKDAWLDLGARPYRVHLRAAVVHGTPILIDVSERTRRLTIHPQDQPEAVLISGPYVIDPRPVHVAP